MSVVDPANKSLYALHLFTQAASMRNLKLVCPVCASALKNAVESAACLHLFCEHCAASSVADKNCPVCGKPVAKSDLRPSPAVRAAIDDQEVCCIHPQCKQWRGKRKELEEHLSSKCEHTLVACGLCAKTMPRGQLAAHQSTHCESRGLYCQYCNKVEKACELARHQDRCELRPVHCPNGCDDKLVLACKQMQVHTATTCPKQAVVCPLLPVGCLVRPTRKDLDKHLADPYFLPQHLRGMHTLCERLGQLEATVRQLEEKCSAAAVSVTFHSTTPSTPASTVSGAAPLVTGPVNGGLVPAGTAAVASAKTLTMIPTPTPPTMPAPAPVAATASAAWALDAPSGHSRGFYFWFPESPEPLQVGDILDVRDTSSKWLLAQVVDQNPTGGSLLIHYLGWPNKWDECLPAPPTDNSSHHQQSPPHSRLQPALSRSTGYTQHWLKGRPDAELITRILEEQLFQKGWGCCGALNHQSICSAAGTAPATNKEGKEGKRNKAL